MATDSGQSESLAGTDPIPNFGLTIPFKYYIPEPRLESENLDEDAIRKEYEALTLQKLFREKEEFHQEFQKQFSLAVTTDEIIQQQLNEMHPPLPKSITKSEMKGAMPTNILEECTMNGVK